METLSANNVLQLPLYHNKNHGLKLTDRLLLEGLRKFQNKDHGRLQKQTWRKLNTTNSVAGVVSPNSALEIRSFVYRDDLEFLQHLLDNYLIWITTEENVEAVQTVGIKILADTKICKSLLKKVNKQLSYLVSILDEPYKYDSKISRKEHQVLEDEINMFIRAIRYDRKQLFAVTKHFTDSEQYYPCSNNPTLKSALRKL
ncbi:MAG: hypothetical protein ABJN95_05860 [Maribacter sp.]|uniref:hypothetical protein n=1 Tax=Maribacter sp. TaxID=1897614 RepID=UPI003297CBCF